MQGPPAVRYMQKHVIKGRRTKVGCSSKLMPPRQPDLPTPRSDWKTEPIIPKPRTLHDGDAESGKVISFLLTITTRNKE